MFESVFASKEAVENRVDIFQASGVVISAASVCPTSRYTDVNAVGQGRDPD